MTDRLTPTGPKHDRYDAVVIGAGIGGLSAAALLARSGRRVLVAEQGQLIGGYAQTFKRGPYTFDPAIHVIPQAADGTVLDVTLRHLGVRDQVEFLPVRGFYDVALPDLVFSAPHGRDAFEAAHAELFPEDREALHRFLTLSAAIHAEAHSLPPQISLRDLDSVATAFPTVFAHQKDTLGELLSELASPRLRTLVSASWPYVGETPARLSFLTYSQMLNTMMNGAYYCRGGFDNLAAALAAAVRLNGGEVVIAAPVRQIVVEAGAARGVVLEDGTRISTDVVVSNADARSTFESLVGEDHVPASLLKRLRRMQPSHSAFVVYAVCRADLRGAGVAHETFIHRHWDHEQSAADIAAGRPGGAWVSVPSVTDPTLAPDGEHVVVLVSMARRDIGHPWAQDKDSFSRDLIQLAEGAVPALRGELEILGMSTPETLERYSRNQSGAAYGWANTPAQTASRRLSHATPVAGLYLSGHWTQPGSTSLRVFVSGIHTAVMVMLAAGEAPPELTADDVLPPVR